MKEIIKQLEYHLATVPEKFRALGEVSLSRREGPDRWSKKEILGHLVDSAMNNLQRVIRVQYEPGVKIVYDQNKWVQIQGHQKMDVDFLLEYWIVLNRQFIRVVDNFPGESLQDKIDTGKHIPEPHTAEYLITDYVAHMEHHLGQIFPSGS